MSRVKSKFEKGLDHLANEPTLKPRGVLDNGTDSNFPNMEELLPNTDAQNLGVFKPEKEPPSSPSLDEILNS